MHTYPVELYTVFSFIGFVVSVIPLYWHLEAWNMGTCMFMIWTALGCLLQCVNSIVWNGNTINRAPVYCDISTRIQVALNVAIPASSLCINRRLCKIATLKNVMMTSADKRRVIIIDLLIGTGLPILQVIAQYIVSTNRYDIFEDFGPYFATALTPLTFVLFYGWPVVIGLVSLYYSVTTIFTFYKRQRRFREVMTFSQGLSRGRYLRLMAIALCEILGTIPLGTYIIVLNSSGVTPYRSWAFVHGHYSEVYQIPSVVWKNSSWVIGLEMFRWSLVACAFVFFGLFGFADEARQHYHLVYTSLARRIGYSTSTPHGSSQATSLVPQAKNKDGVIVCLGRTTGDKCRSESSDSFADQLPTVWRSSSISNDTTLNLKVERYSPSNAVSLFSLESNDESEARMQGQPTLPEVVLPTVPPASVPPHFPEKTKSIMRAHPCAHAV